MTKIDRYILKQFVLTTLFSLIAITIIFVAINLMDNLDDFLDLNASIGMITMYYLYFIPEIIKLMIPVAMLLSALFTTGRLSTYNELTALKSSGVSLYRYMAPVFIFAILVSIASIYFNGWIVPSANKKKFEIGRVYFQKDIQYVSKTNIFIQDSKTRILSIGMFDDSRGVAMQVSIQDFNLTDPTIVNKRYDANEMHWLSGSGMWTLYNGTERSFQDSLEIVRQFDSLSIGALNFTPDDIRKKQE
ncbi:MAG: LptF/LptG family permease, partial [Bacteroidota bacterium]|nr:LptF/LptG family permease [Bacteroidota bacterium]